jgi:hypothetical protein
MAAQAPPYFDGILEPTGSSEFMIEGSTAMDNDFAHELRRGVEDAYFAKFKSGLLDVGLSIAVVAGVVAFATAAVAWVSSAAVSADAQATAALATFAFGAAWVVGSITGVAIGRLMRSKSLHGVSALAPSNASPSRDQPAAHLRSAWS